MAPADDERPIRASQRARLRGSDGVRRDDFYGSAPQGSGTAPSHTDAQVDGPQGSPPPIASRPTSTSDSPRHATRQPAPAEESTQAFPSRRARREALARQQAQEARNGSSSQDAASYEPPAPETRATRRSRRDRSGQAAGPTFHDSGVQPAAAGAAAGAGAAVGATAASGVAAASTRAPGSAGAAAGEPVGARSRSRERTRAAVPATAEDSAPRHSRREGDAFPSIVRWTTLGTLLPGLGMIRGRSRTGWILLLGFLAGILALIAWIIWRSPVKVVARVAGSPTILYAIAVVLLVGILIWAFTILRSYSVLKRGKRLTDVQKWLGWGLVASLMLCVGIPLGVGAAYSKVQGDTVIQVFGRDGKQGVDVETLWADTERINVFLIGRDNGDNREGTRPDTMLVASIKPATGDTTLISVPRNLNRAQFPEGTQLAERFPYGFDGFGPEESMINAVWTWAEEYPEEVGDVPENLETGMEATMQAVEGSLGLSLDYYASVDMQGFEDVVDAIGGVNIDVERPIPMGGGTNLNTGLKNPIYGWIDPGEQTLTGQKALWYVRSREGADNYDRMCRQQRMLKLTIDQVDPQELAIAYPKLAGSAGRNIATDIPQSEVSAFVELAVAMQRGEIKSAQITNDVTSTSNPDYDVLHEWVDEQLNPAEPSQAEEQNEATEETEEPTEEPTPEPESGIEDDEGKCYPQGYEPGSGWPGWPGAEEA